MLIRVSLARQTLTLLDERGEPLRQYPVSTAANGAGEEEGSAQTPRGHHLIRAKIGAGCPLYTVFSARRPTGERWSPELDAAQPGRDWILTRILWLSGCEPGFNRGMRHEQHPSTNKNFPSVRPEPVEGRGSTGSPRTELADGENQAPPVCVDTMRRYIYIHGCGETAPMTAPRSHGCIRMKNRDVLELFDLTPVYTQVEIGEE